MACSDASATAEVADGAAILFPPSDIGAIARAMRDVLADAELRQRMERLGLQRAAQFQWREAAARTLEVYCGVVEGCRAAKSKSRREAAQAVPVSRP